MGDLMHALPALTEAKDQIPEVSFDWVVDKEFSIRPQLAPCYQSTLVTNHSQWKLNLISAKSRDEIKRVMNEINENDYDIIIDMQNNLKSSFIFIFKKICNRNGCEKCKRISSTFGLQKKSVYFKKLHAIERQRELMAFALGYKTQDKDFGYGISENKFTNPSFQLPSKYVCVCSKC